MTMSWMLVAIGLCVTAVTQAFLTSPRQLNKWVEQILAFWFLCGLIMALGGLISAILEMP